MATCMYSYNYKEFVANINGPSSYQDCNDLYSLIYMCAQYSDPQETVLAIGT